MLPEHTFTDTTISGSPSKVVLIDYESPTPRQLSMPLVSSTSSDLPPPPIFNGEAAFKRKGGCGLNADFTYEESDDACTSVAEICNDWSNKENENNKEQLNNNCHKSDEYRKKKREERFKRETLNRIALQQEQIGQGRKSEAHDVEKKKENSDNSMHSKMQVQAQQKESLNENDQNREELIRQKREEIFYSRHSLAPDISHQRSKQLPPASLFANPPLPPSRIQREGSKPTASFYRHKTGGRLQECINTPPPALQSSKAKFKMLSTSAIISTPEDEMEEAQLSTVNVATAADTTTNVNMSNKLHGHKDTDDMLHLNSSRNDASSISPLSATSTMDTSQTSDITQLECEKKELIDKMNRLHIDREEERKAKESEIERLSNLVGRLEKANADLENKKSREAGLSPVIVYNDSSTHDKSSESSSVATKTPDAMLSCSLDDEMYLQESNHPSSSCQTPTSHELLSQAVQIISRLRQEIKVVKSEKSGKDRKSRVSRQTSSELSRKAPLDADGTQSTTRALVAVSPLKGILEEFCVDTCSNSRKPSDLKVKSSGCDDCLSPEERLSLQSQAMRCLQEDEAALQRSMMGFSSTPRAGNGKNKGVISFFGCMFDSICPG